MFPQHHRRTECLGERAHWFVVVVVARRCFFFDIFFLFGFDSPGNDANSQILATECLCNLSLGTEIACEKLTLLTGTYLITFLNSQNERLAVSEVHIVYFA